MSERPADRLREAVLNGEVMRVEKLSQRPRYSLINYDSVNGWSSLHYAARFNLIEMVDTLLELGHDDRVISRDLESNTPMMLACQYGHTEVFMRIAKKYPNSLDSRNKKGWTCLFFAARYLRTDMLTYLLEAGVDVNHKDKSGSTALHYASAYGFQRGIELLLEAGAKPAVRNLAGWTAADWAYSAKLYEILTSGSAKAATADSLPTVVVPAEAAKDQSSSLKTSNSILGRHRRDSTAQRR